MKLCHMYALLAAVAVVCCICAVLVTLALLEFDFEAAAFYGVGVVTSGLAWSFVLGDLLVFKRKDGGHEPS